jgi:uncharacterized protein YbaP (TraB family)
MRKFMILVTKSAKHLAAPAALGLLLACSGAALPQPAFAQPAAVSSAPASAPIEEVEVVGERPGPSLWRVSRGDHVLWLLGTLDPLPRKMTWRSREVESVVAQSQEVLASNPSVSANIGPFLAIRLYLQWRRTEKIPEKADLRAWLPPPLYARFAALKLRFAPRDARIEEMRPIFAARRLYDEVIDASGLTSRNDIQDTVIRLARKHNVRIVRTSLKIEDPRGVLNEVGEIPRQAEINCLDATVERLDTDLGAMKVRARAWSEGDVETLRKLPFPNQREVCLSAVANAPRIKGLVDRASADWNAALEAALARNSVTLATKPIYDLIGADGTLAQLRAKGYTVEGP